MALTFEWDPAKAAANLKKQRGRGAAAIRIISVRPATLRARRKYEEDFR